MSFETPESGMGLVQKLMEKEHRGKAVGKAQNWGKFFHRMVSQMRKSALQQGGVTTCGGERILWSPLGQQMETQHTSGG